MRPQRREWTPLRLTEPEGFISNRDDDQFAESIAPLVNSVSRLSNHLMGQRLERNPKTLRVDPGGSPQGNALRITPGLFTLTSELDTFVDALHRLNQMSSL